MAIETAGNVAELARLEERSRIVATLRKEADECANVVETMVQSEYHAKLRDTSERWATIAAYASRAARAIDLIDQIDHEDVPQNGEGVSSSP